MNLEVFDVSWAEGRLAFKDFTASHLVDHIGEVATTDAIWVIVYYHKDGEQSDSERVRLAAHMAIANECASNYEFNNLRDQRTKELWLLAEWGIATVDAKDIICLASDGMARVREKVVT